MREILSIVYNSEDEGLKSMKEIGYFDVSQAKINPPSKIFTEEEKNAAVNEECIDKKLKMLTPQFIEQLDKKRIKNLYDQISPYDVIDNDKDYKKSLAVSDIKSVLFYLMFRYHNHLEDPIEIDLKKIFEKDEGNIHHSRVFDKMAKESSYMPKKSEEEVKRCEMEEKERNVIKQKRTGWIRKYFS